MNPLKIRVYPLLQNMEEEIDLMDYIKVIIKRWKLILVIFLVAIFVSAGVSFILPKTYQTRAVVKIGKAEGKVLENITETIEILKGKFPGVTLSNLKGTSLVEIKAQGETPQQALDRVNNTVDFLLSRHEKIYNEAKLFLEEEINDIQSGLEKMGSEITGIESNVQERETEIGEIGAKIQKEEATENQARALIIQGYLLRLTAEKNRKETLAVQKQQLVENERELEEKLKAKELAKELNFEPTQIEISATLPQNPTKPNIKLNLLVAAVLGLFVGALLAFGLEWWKKENKTVENVFQ